MKIKEHHLMTIEDIFDIATEDNFVDLMYDISDVVAFYINMKKVCRKKEYKSLKHRGIIWKNDGISGMTSVELNGKILKRDENNNS
jgi:hypothetical protein